MVEIFLEPQKYAALKKLYHDIGYDFIYKKFDL